MVQASGAASVGMGVVWRTMICCWGLVTGPEIGLSSGCFVGPELIEGES